MLMILTVDEIIASFKNRKYGSSLTIKKKPGLQESILTTTEFLNTNYKLVSMSQRLWHIHNKKLEVIMCPACGVNPAEFYPHRGEYRICGHECKEGVAHIINTKSTGVASQLIKLFGLLPQLKIKTNFLNSAYIDIPIKQRIWHIKQNILTLYMCPICHTKPAKFSIYRGYITCGPECYTKSIMNTSMQRYGITSKILTSGGMEKSRAAKMEKYGTHTMDCSKIPTIKIAKFNTAKRKFLETLNPEYELIEFGTNQPNMNPQSVTHRLRHKVCGSEFDIMRYLYIQRKNDGADLCTLCSPVGHMSTSTQEKQVLSFIQSIYDGPVELHHRGFSWLVSPHTGKRMELDLYLPELQIGIECMGDFWHGNPLFFEHDDEVYYLTVGHIWKKDNRKRELCEDNGIKLLQIWEHDWKKRKQLAKDMLVHFITKVEDNKYR